MPSPSPKPVIFLVVVAVAMALLVGLVDSARRPSTTTPELGPLEPWAPLGAGETVLAPPRNVESGESAAPATPPALAQRPEADERERLVGLVLRPDGEPAAGARVKLGGQSTRSSAEGRFQLALFAGLEAEDLVAYLAGFEPVVLPGFGAQAGGAGEVRLVLGPETVALAGTVIDAGGQPLKGWTVELDGPDVLRDHGLREPLRTDIEGRFVLKDVPSGVQRVRVWRKNRERATLSG